MATIWQAQYSVVLKSEIPPREKELLEKFGTKISSESGVALIHFRCASIDISHSFYIKMEIIIKTDDEFPQPLHIPHHYVLLISGADSSNPLGFLLDESENSHGA